MKVYYIYPDKYDYDEFDGIVVVAENEDRALAMIENGYFRKSYFNQFAKVLDGVRKGLCFCGASAAY